MDSVSLWLMAANPDIRSRWNRWLTAGGWSVVEVPGFEALRGLPRQGKTGSALLDASMVKEPDLPVVRELSASKIPVILFGEGQDASNESIVRWLHEGADDFISSSIHEQVLIAKLEAFARRILPELDRTVLFSRSRRIKANSRRGLAWIRGDSGEWEPAPALTKTEHSLLCLFLSLQGTPLEREFILERIWGKKAEEIFSATLTQHMASLRKKLGKHGEALRTVYGRGYLFLEE